MCDDISFCELRKKEVVNASDGTKLGHIVDMIISIETKRASGLIAPAKKGGLFSKEQDVFIPLDSIIKIGSDVILIDLCAPTDKKEKHNDCKGSCKLYE